MKLSEQKCTPCEGGTLPVTPKEAKIYLSELNRWEQEENKIKKTFVFKNFKRAIKFVNEVAEVAEKEGHHPDIAISYNKVNIFLWTHAIGGLSLNDFIVAAKIDAIEI